MRKGTRSIEFCQNVIDDLKKQTGSDKVSCIDVDLTLFKSVKRFVAEIKKRIPQYEIQLLISKN